MTVCGHSGFWQLTICATIQRQQQFIILISPSYCRTHCIYFRKQLCPFKANNIWHTLKSLYSGQTAKHELLLSILKVVLSACKSFSLQLQHNCYSVIVINCCTKSQLGQTHTHTDSWLRGAQKTRKKVSRVNRTTTRNTQHRYIFLGDALNSMQHFWQQFSNSIGNASTFSVLCLT